ncbi:MAG: starch-binding protein [Prevotella sp.]|nr:starch-binding protein [Prevotella sp.]
MTPEDALSSVEISSSSSSGELSVEAGAAGYYMVFGTLRFYASSITVTPAGPVAPATKSITFTKPESWSSVYVWAWNGTGDQTVNLFDEWPGLELTANDEGKYVWETTESPEYVIFSDNGQNQTADLAFIDGSDYTVGGLVISSMTVVGDIPGSWEIVDGWAMTQSDDIWTVTQENITLTVGNYALKAVANGAWGVCDVPATSGENYVLGISEKGIYTISITVNTNTKVMSVEATKTANAPIETLTIVGTFLGKTGDDNWKFENGWAMTQMEATMGSESTIWTLNKENVDLKAGTYEYKVVANNDWDDQQWPASGNNTLTIEEDGVYDLNFFVNTAAEQDPVTVHADRKGDVEPNYGYYVCGEGGILGGWSATYEMTLGEDGLYSWTPGVKELDAQTIAFKVIRKDKKGFEDDVWYPAGTDNNQTIVIETKDYYTVTIKFNATTGEITKDCVTRVKPEYAANNVYFWESPDGIVNQNGGTVSAKGNDGNDTTVDDINMSNASYKTIRLRGAKDFSTNVVVITLDNALKAGDEIAITAYRNKDTTEKKSGALLKFNDEASTTLTIGDGLEFNNINTAEAVAAEFGEPNTITAVVPEAVDGATTITLTRSQTATNLFITKIEITRPNITHTATFTTNKGWEEVAAYVWSGEDSNKVLGEWPGTVLEADAEGVYTVTIEALEAPEHIIFNNNDNGQQTADLVFENGKAYSYNSLTLASTADNTAAIDENDGNTADVTLEGVTLYKDGLWFTLCLPFDVADFGGTPLADATVHAMDAANSNLTDGTLTLNFITGIGSIEAGKPYIVKWNDGTDIENPEFKNVTIKKDAPVAVEGSKVSFVGTYAQMASVTDANKLFLGVDGTQSALYTPAAADLGAFRAYFNVEGASQVRQFVLNFDGETTGIGASLMNSERVNNAVYNLNGQRVAQPSKGLYIVNGRKVVIK